MTNDCWLLGSSLGGLNVSFMCDEEIKRSCLHSSRHNTSLRNKCCKLESVNHPSSKFVIG